jgi:uncharacterized protein (UPF0333 family)
MSVALQIKSTQNDRYSSKCTSAIGSRPPKLCCFCSIERGVSALLSLASAVASIALIGAESTDGFTIVSAAVAAVAASVAAFVAAAAAAAAEAAFCTVREQVVAVVTCQRYTLTDCTRPCEYNVCTHCY